MLPCQAGTVLAEPTSSCCGGMLWSYLDVTPTAMPPCSSAQPPMLWSLNGGTHTGQAIDCALLCWEALLHGHTGT